MQPTYPPYPIPALSGGGSKAYKCLTYLGGTMDPVSVPCASSPIRLIFTYLCRQHSHNPLWTLAWRFIVVSCKKPLFCRSRLLLHLGNWVIPNTPSLQERCYAARYPIRPLRIQGAVLRSATGGTDTCLRLGKVLEPFSLLSRTPSRNAFE